MGYHFHEDGDPPAIAPPAMSCEILFASGAVAVVDITVTGPDGSPRSPRVEEWAAILKSLVTQQFKLTTHSDA